MRRSPRLLRRRRFGAPHERVPPRGGDGRREAEQVSSSFAAGFVGLACFGALACGGTEKGGSVAAESTERPPASAPSTDPFAPPDDARRLCGGHVTMAPDSEGEVGAHIVWEAWASPESPKALSARYARRLGPPERSSERDCTSWRQPAEEARRVLEICATGAPGPWTDCSAPPTGAASIFLVSSKSSPGP